MSAANQRKLWNRCGLGTHTSEEGIRVTVRTDALARAIRATALLRKMDE
jgi:hypothetical protein